jgi:hypothetical protein
MGSKLKEVTRWLLNTPSTCREEIREGKYEIHNRIFLASTHALYSIFTILVFAKEEQA